VRHMFLKIKHGAQLHHQAATSRHWIEHNRDGKDLQSPGNGVGPFGRDAELLPSCSTKKMTESGPLLHKSATSTRGNFGTPPRCLHMFLTQRADTPLFHVLWDATTLPTIRVDRALAMSMSGCKNPVKGKLKPSNSGHFSKCQASRHYYLAGLEQAPTCLHLLNSFSTAMSF
jgi:hypothetical protein